MLTVLVSHTYVLHVHVLQTSCHHYLTAEHVASLKSLSSSVPLPPSPPLPHHPTPSIPRLSYSHQRPLWFVSADLACTAPTALVNLPLSLPPSTNWSPSSVFIRPQTPHPHPPLPSASKRDMDELTISSANEALPSSPVSLAPSTVAASRRGGSQRGCCFFV
jgi:hypothetical protein